MSGLDNHAISLGIHHVDHPINKTNVCINDERLTKEMRITFDIEELSSFFAGFIKPDTDALFTIAGC
ncbi:MAG: hypothetical protein JW841_14515 [Deltaproteobacteria bacterium]|nr:hypothetical protein [Deltaproteobacteria bacterium]